MCYKDQLCYLIIERWGKKPTVNTQHKIILNQRHDKYKDIKKMAVYYKKLIIDL